MSAGFDTTTGRMDGLGDLRDYRCECRRRYAAAIHGLMQGQRHGFIATRRPKCQQYCHAAMWIDRVRVQSGVALNQELVVGKCTAIRKT
jgi:hypothetical protein